MVTSAVASFSMALGLDETLRCRLGERRRQHWTTQIVDVEAGQLLDVVAGRTAAGPIKWLEDRTPEWRAGVRWATLDLSGAYRRAFDTMLGDAVQVADPFHLVKVRHEALCVQGWVRGPPCWSVAADR